MYLANSIRLVLLGTLPLVTLAGCSNGEQSIHTVPVTGKIHGVEGSEISGLAVHFLPEQSSDLELKENGSQQFTGRIDDQGHFSLKTGNEKNGAPPGDYRIVLASHPDGTGHPSDPNSLADLMPDSRLGEIPVIYQSYDKTPWRAIVKDGEMNEFTFEFNR